MKKSFLFASALFFAWFGLSAPTYAATANNAAGSSAQGCPEDCPGCEAALKARNDYIQRDMDIQEKTVLREDLVAEFPNCQEIIDLVMAPFNFQYMSFDIAAILPAIASAVFDAVCGFILDTAKGFINGILNLFNDSTELPYGLGNVVTLNSGGASGSVSPNIPSVPSIPRL